MPEQIGPRSRCSSAMLPTYVATSQPRAPTPSLAHSLKNYGTSISGQNYSDVQWLVPKPRLTILTTTGRQELTARKNFATRPHLMLHCLIPGGRQTRNT